MYCIVGLGNPGKRYFKTRHNVGFFICDALAKYYNVIFEKGPGQYDWSHVKIESNDVVLIKPTTYMNRSGIAFDDIKKRYVLLNSNCMIVFDDYHLPLGKLRIRPKGSDGGHNGLASIINYNRTTIIPRMRIGIGHPERKNIVEYVLADFKRSEKKMIDQTVEYAIEAINFWIQHGIEKTMSIYN